MDFAGAWQVAIYMCNGIMAAASNTTVTLTFTSSTWAVCEANEYSSVAATGPIDSASTAQGSETSGSAPITTTNANDILLTYLDSVPKNAFFSCDTHCKT